MIIENSPITVSGVYGWPWDCGGFIVVRGGSGGEGGSNTSGAGGCKEGEDTSVTIESRTIRARGGKGGEGRQPGGANGCGGTLGQTTIASVSVPKGTEIHVRIGNGGAGGEGGNCHESPGGGKGADGEVFFVPALI